MASPTARSCACPRSRSSAPRRWRVSDWPATRSRPTQTLDAGQLRRAGDAGLAGATLETRLPSVTLNEIQGNPYQADLNYRATASPLLGTAQGPSEIPRWRTHQRRLRRRGQLGPHPRAAIAGITLVPGSNPLYWAQYAGRGAGASDQDGRSDPGGEPETSLGSVPASHGVAAARGSKDALSWFGAIEGMQEDGWRDHSPSEVGQFFGKLGWQGMATDVSLSLAHANTDLIGNGLLPESMLAARRRAIFTHPTKRPTE